MNLGLGLELRLVLPGLGLGLRLVLVLLCAESDNLGFLNFGSLGSDFFATTAVVAVVAVGGGGGPSCLDCIAVVDVFAVINAAGADVANGCRDGDDDGGGLTLSPGALAAGFIATSLSSEPKK